MFGNCSNSTFSETTVLNLVIPKDLTFKNQRASKKKNPAESLLFSPFFNFILPKINHWQRKQFFSFTSLFLSHSQIKSSKTVEYLTLFQIGLHCTLLKYTHGKFHNHLNGI